MLTDYSGDIAYISTFIDVPVLVAAARFDDLLDKLGPGTGVLLLDAKPAISSAVRSVPGTLRSRRGRVLSSVLIELDVWSQDRTQLGVRPTRSKAGSPAGYFAAGYAVLEELAQALAVEQPRPPALIARRGSAAALRRARPTVQPA
jgi:hypothetical protein